ncbi:hypothetical protein FQN57_006405 [Myotisia sp. PD_48]|nr:hypothetical protein FQN57_006405 [Myotisia sp. PD_48]
MKLTQAREYLTRFYIKARRNSKHRRSKSSGSGGKFAYLPEPHHPGAQGQTYEKGSVFSAAHTDSYEEERKRKLEKNSGEKISIQNPHSGLSTDTSCGCLTLHTTGQQPSSKDGPSNDVETLNDKPKLPVSQDTRPDIGGNNSKLAASSISLSVPPLDTCGMGNGRESGVTTPRNLSTHSLLSVQSNTTVLHDPTKRVESPIGRIDAIIQKIDPNPFSDSNAVKALEESRCPLVPRGSSQDFSTRAYKDCPLKRSHPPTRHCPGHSSESSSHGIASRKSSRSSSGVLQQIPDVEEPILAVGIGSPFGYFGAEETRAKAGDFDRQESLMSRIRKVRSNLTIKRKDNNNQSLRRMKSYLHVGSLRSKPKGL